MEYFLGRIHEKKLNWGYNNFTGHSISLEDLQMFKDIEPEVVLYVDDNVDDISVEISEIDENSPLAERFVSWLEIIDN